MSRPNILYIHSHDTGRTIRPYGFAAETPYLQRLADEGVLFRQAFCAGPTCSPSRAALLTGQSPHGSGMLGVVNRGFRLKDYGRHLVHTLRQVGYTSALAGVQHVAADPTDIGYDLILKSDSHSVEHVAPVAADFVTRRPSEPFFLSVGFFETHREFHAPEPEVIDRCRVPAPLPDAPETRRDMAGFLASVRELDRGVEAVLDALEASGQAENTLVIATTDHGMAFPGMKCTLTDHGLGVMLILRGPDGFAGGKSVDAMVSHVDVFPTLCDLLDIDRPSWLEGHSLLPLVRGEVDSVRDEVFGEVTYHAAYEPQRCIRTRRWKYIRRFDERSRPVLPNCDDSPSKDLWLAHGWADRAPPAEQLYDLVFDPNEVNNVAADNAMAEVLADLRARLDAWMQRTDDPLLNGPVSAPAGARVNDPDGLSPKERPHLIA